MKKLTFSNEHYIKAIYELEHDDDGASISEIAGKLNVTKPSVCVGMKALQQKKLIERDAYHKVLLTPEGKRQAEIIVNKYKTIKLFLMKVFNIDNKTASADACALEHVVSLETIRAMMDLTDQQRELKK